MQAIFDDGEENLRKETTTHILRFGYLLVPLPLLLHPLSNIAFMSADQQTKVDPAPSIPQPSQLSSRGILHSSHDRDLRSSH